MVEEECKEITNIKKDETITSIKQVENCKPFVVLSILFVCVSIILTGIVIYFSLKMFYLIKIISRKKLKLSPN